MKEERYSIFLEKVDLLSGGKLKHKDDLFLLISVADKEKKEKDFEEIIFFAKFIVSLFRILQKKQADKEGENKIKEEFSLHLQKIKSMLSVFMHTDSGEAEEFEKKYFSQNRDSFALFIELLTDLSWIKNSQIDNKKLW